MEPTNQFKSKPNALYIAIGMLCVVVFVGLVCWQSQKPEKKSGATEQNQNSSTTNNQASNNVASTPTQPASKAENFYSQGSEALTAQNFSEAIKYFDQAIAEDPYEPQYFSDKSEAQYNSGDKQGAINTLKRGSSLNPDSDLLKSKLDVLTKDQFSDPTIDTPRE